MVQWTAEKDQVILKGIFKFHDIKSTAPLLDYLAGQIGKGCTPKAVSHRLNNIRSTGKPLSKASTPNASRVRHPKTPKTPGSRAKKPATPITKAKDANNESDTESGPENDLGGDDDEPLSPIAARKRARSTPRKNYQESDAASEVSDVEDTYVPMAKRVKTEPAEVDLGQIPHDISEEEY